MGKRVFSKEGARRFFSKNILWRLEAWKEDVGSWQEIAKRLNVPIRTIHRWRKKRKIGDSYIRVLEAELEKIQKIP